MHKEHPKTAAEPQQLEHLTVNHRVCFSVHRKRMTIQDSLQHPWIKVGLMSAFGFCYPSFSSFNIYLVSFPIISQRTLSRL